MESHPDIVWKSSYSELMRGDDSEPLPVENATAEDVDRNSDDSEREASWGVLMRTAVVCS